MIMLKQIDIDAIKILVSSFNYTQIDNATPISEVLAELEKQMVFCLPYGILTSNDNLASEKLNSYKAKCYQAIAKNIQLMVEQQKVVDFLEKSGIKFVILKGTAAAMYYPQPELRLLGDIDIIVKPEDLKKTYQVLEEHYNCIHTFKENPRHANFVTMTGTEIELHSFFSFGKKNEKNNLLDQMIYSGIDRREWHEISGYRFPTLPAVENGLVLLNHVYMHLKNSGVGYRQLFDFREYIVAENEHLDKFLKKARKVGLERLAAGLIQICQKHLGVDTGIDTAQIDDECLDELISAFARSGNFGRKEIASGGRRAEAVIRGLKNPFKLAIWIQKNGRKHWQLSDKYVFLRPFAWIYQIGYYFRQVRKYGGVSVIVDGKNRASDKEKLLKEFGLS